jgi:hypothetical protein
MSKSSPETLEDVVLGCGCTIKDISDELSQECIPHKQGNFIQ